ncbi:2,3-diaminopropionate biosynthesis protein SbnA [Allosaccharopolyspora coralli]|uniref:N-(2-amino-2-carboxyethyl)-L-glutamate synthase n=1 Tax=Allosaccharopolyspora coralli TaxID=2665642 RepID=A0A5Q3Q6H6_9PSEU|nr:2,3-diaminopropionate biosynthesis protein SbnA [Allosaccharopolyspora coralli]QGK70208.1 2,3-diaminopropionate biosynthesis protein SbnA [Allosaccharopolyspora coralli]
MIHDSVVSCVGATPMVRLDRCFPESDAEVIAKLEMLNPGGSMKDRPARFIVEQGLHEGTLRPGTRLVESTSGNLGIALAMAAGLYGLSFTAVVDPKTSPINLRLLRLFGADVEMVDEPDESGGYLHTRVRRARELVNSMPNAVLVNQYANDLNWRSYHDTAGEEILEAVDGPVDYLVAAVSTTGSIQGIARRLRQEYPHLKVIAVDAVGSVIFGAPPAPRQLPGFGASRVPEILDRSAIDDIVYVADAESAAGCRRLLDTEKIFAGGSSGAVVAGIEHLVSRLDRPSRIVTLLPDRGERYLDLVYDDNWVASLSEPWQNQEVADTVTS